MKLFKSNSGKQSDTAPTRRRSAQADDSIEFVRQFRRGQTLTGSSSNRVRSTSELNASLLSPRATTHHLSHHRRRLGFKLVAVLGVCLALYLTASQLIATVSLSTAENVSAKQEIRYLALFDEYFRGHPVQRFAPSLDRAGLLRYLQNNHPEIKAVDIVLSAELGKADLNLTLREPIARWNLSGSNEFVDTRGTVFTYTPFAAPALEIVDNTGLPPSSTNQVTSSRFLGFVGLIVGGLEQRGYVVNKAIIPPMTTRQLDINIEGVPYAFKLNTDRSAGEQVEDIVRTIEFFQSKGENPSYVDVRVKGKGFYR